MTDHPNPDFFWPLPRHRHAFSIQTREPASDGTPRPVLLLGEDVAMEVSLPLETPIALYLELARCRPTPEGVLAFANRYGYLGLCVGADGRCQPEPVTDWVVEILWMREAVKIWRGLREKKKTEELGERFYQEGGTARYHPPPELLKALGADSWEESAAEGDDWAGKNNVRMAALRFLHRLVNGRLAKFGSFGMYLEGESKSQVGYVPASLLGAIYLRFALAVSRGTKTKKCETCRREFELEPWTVRADRKFCREGCRSKAYRGRQEKARRLRQEGKTVGEIAEELGADEETVKGWTETLEGE